MPKADVRVYTEPEITDRLAAELPKWRLENGWIRRKYKTHSWKSTMMAVNTVGHLAEAAWHHPDLSRLLRLVRSEADDARRQGDHR